MPMTPPKAVLFDAGNTLVWLDHPFMVQVLREHGVQTTVERIMDAEYQLKLLMDAQAREKGDERPRGWKYFEAVFRLLGVPEEVFAPVGQQLFARHTVKHLWSSVRERTAETLDELRRRGYRLGVISNADGKVDALLETVGLRPHFELVIDSGAVGIDKPDPRIFRMALERLGVEPHEAVYVGDIYEIDVQGARAAGMRAILVDPRGRWGHLDCERITGIHDLLDLLP